MTADELSVYINTITNLNQFPKCRIIRKLQGYKILKKKNLQMAAH